MKNEENKMDTKIIDKEYVEKFIQDMLAIVKKQREEINEFKKWAIRELKTIGRVKKEIPINNEVSDSKNFTCEISARFITKHPLSKEEQSIMLSKAAKEVEIVMEKYKLGEMSAKLLRLFD